MLKRADGRGVSRPAMQMLRNVRYGIFEGVVSYGNSRAQHVTLEVAGMQS